MPSQHILITGGAGFIGSHLADELLRRGHQVRVLDALLPQVHPRGAPSYLSGDVELRVGDVRDESAINRALDGVDSVVHFAAAVGVGQSMYEIRHYCSINVQGTASLLEAIHRARRRPNRLLVASSMSVYGEGLYRCPTCGVQAGTVRPRHQLSARDWDVRCPVCGQAMASEATPESKTLAPTSVYAINKRDQEEMVLNVARSLSIPANALRFFNVYGARQALSNPYTGVAAIFSSCLLNAQPPPVFEDGRQARDFIHVSDVVRACRLVLEAQDVANKVINVGTGRATTLLELVALLRRDIRDLEPEVLGRFREGDIRTCYADISEARTLLGYEPRVAIEDGARGLADWVASQSSVDRSRQALAELRTNNLVD